MIERFEIRVDDSVLEDLRNRLASTRLPDQIEGTGWEYGIPVDFVRELVEYWRDTYDWRVHEARLNELAHFRTSIDGQSIHFIHARSPHAKAFPLLLTHGWPGSVVEFLDVIPRLTDPEAHDASAADAFHVSYRRCRATASPSRPGRGAGTSGASQARSPS
jgi:hypothetical protein